MAHILVPVLVEGSFVGLLLGFLCLLFLNSYQLFFKLLLRLMEANRKYS